MLRIGILLGEAGWTLTGDERETWRAVNKASLQSFKGKTSSSGFIGSPVAYTVSGSPP